ncbi:MAG: DUF1554 domain-containing protein [Spirochaetota bacterium]
MITGLNGAMVLKNGEQQIEIVSGENSFLFAGQASGTAYQVEFVSYPSEQYCSISDASGTVVEENITNVTISCYAKKKIFLSNTTYRGNLVGSDSNFDTADSYCNSDSNKPSDNSNYKALLGGFTRYPGGSDWVFANDIAYVRSVGDVFLVKITETMSYTELVNSLNGQGNTFWTGLDANWNISNNCCTWSSSTNSCNGNLGIGNVIDKTSIAYTTSSCDTKYKLLCVEQ